MQQRLTILQLLRPALQILSIARINRFSILDLQCNDGLQGPLYCLERGYLFRYTMHYHLHACIV